MTGEQPFILYREADEGDAVGLVDYMAALCAEGLDTISRREPPTVEEERAFIQKALGTERAFILIGEIDGQVIALLDLWAGKGAAARHAASFGMSVNQRWRGMGVGRKLLDAAIEKTRQWEGFCRLELEVVPWNKSAISLYEGAGFKIEGRKIKAANMRGDPEDLLVMGLTW